MGEINTPLLEIKNLNVHYKVYGGTLKVLDGVHLSVYPGEKVGLVGETGCGKTTTVKTVLKVLPMPPGIIDDGEVYYKGTDLLKMSGKQISDVRGREISMIFQDPMSALNPVFTVGQQLEPVIKHSAATRLTKKQVQ